VVPPDAGPCPGLNNPNTLGRDVGISPGFANLDLRLTRDIQIHEQKKLQLLFETFNLFNHVNVTDFGRVFLPGTPLPRKDQGRFVVTPDRYRASANARQIQLGFRFQF